MAVTFKVPKSPKRDIEATDSFMGVDLTNTGVSMDIYRSPNAPNMVRDVPGKVRKRMGYYKEIYFGTEDNVNFAWGTSAVERELMVEADEPYKLYDLIQTIKSKDENDYTLYVEFDYKAEEDFTILNQTVEASEDWAHFSGTVECDSSDVFTEVDVVSAAIQEMYFKNFALLRAKDENYEWSPAPKFFVERETNDPIYGCHLLKNGKDVFEGDRVVNTNRALETSDTLRTWSNPTNMFEIYKLGETPVTGTKLYVDFDYKCTADAYIYVGGNNSDVIYCSETSTIRHISEVLPLNYFEARIDAVRLSCDGSFSVQNFSVCYEKDENYKWSKAPEDNGKKFYLSDMYKVNGKDIAVTTELKDESSTFTGDYEAAFSSITTEPAKKYAKLKFTITFDADGSPAQSNLLTSVAVVDSYGFTLFRSDDFYVRNDVKKEEKYELYLSATQDFPSENIGSISTIKANFSTISPGDHKVKTQITHLEVQTFEVKDSYYVSPCNYLYHVGSSIYARTGKNNDFIEIYTKANKHRSCSWQLGEKCYVIDGNNIYIASLDSGVPFEPIGQENAFIPKVTIAKEPTGGGTARDPINLLQPGFYELFQGKASVKKYQLSFKDLDATTCKAWLLNSEAEWIEKSENTDFTVNRATGEITFTTAPGVSPIDGEDNVKILAYRTVEGYRERVTKCTFGVLFGVAGACDRIFLSGNEDHPNWDFYSQKDDPTYFPDTGYSVLGSEQSRVSGYSIVSNYLATFKDGFDQSQTVFIREGDMLETGDEENKTSEPVFKLINTLQGEGVVSPYSFGYMQTEPVFLTRSGVYAITEQDISGEKYSQNRSFYLDGVLRKEENKQNGQAVIYNNQYVLALNGKLYILDGLQATRTDKSEPYATRQYAGFICDNVPANCIWVDDQICFGTNDGKVCRFFSDDKALESYNDDGKAIYACWETPDLDDQLFYKNKTFRYLAVRLMQSLKTTAKMYSRKLGVWTRIYENVVISNPIDFENLDFDLFTFSIDTTEKLMHTKVRVKKVDKARFKIENGEVNEPFGLSDLALEYIQSGNYKG